MGQELDPKLPLPEGSEPPPNTWFLAPTRVHIASGTGIGSAVLAQNRMWPKTDRQAHSSYYICNGSPHLMFCTGMWRNNCSDASGASVSFHALAGHAIDDAVAAGIHEPDGVRREPHAQSKSQARPEDDVEYSWIICRVHRSTVQRILEKKPATTSVHDISCQSTRNSITLNGKDPVC